MSSAVIDMIRLQLVNVLLSLFRFVDFIFWCRRYLDYIKKETSRDKDRLAVLHERVATFSKRAGLASVSSLSDAELDAKVLAVTINSYTMPTTNDSD